MEIVEKIKKFFSEEVNVTEEEGVIKLEFEDPPLLKKEELGEFYKMLEKEGLELIGHEEEQAFKYPTHEMTICNDSFYGDRYDLKVTYTITWNIRQGETFVVDEITIIPKY